MMQGSPVFGSLLGFAPEKETHEVMRRIGVSRVIGILHLILLVEIELAGF